MKVTVVRDILEANDRLAADNRARFEKGREGIAQGAAAALAHEQLAVDEFGKDAAVGGFVQALVQRTELFVDLFAEPEVGDHLL